MAESDPIDYENLNGPFSKQRRDAFTPEQVLRILRGGNQRFCMGMRLNQNLIEERRQTERHQFPHSAILSCIDSRVPAEIVFDMGIGDSFKARVAGNFVNDDILGSLEFAHRVSGAKLLLVMGHTGCGAMRGAVQTVADTASPGSGETNNGMPLYLGRLLSKLRHAVNATDFEGDRTAENDRFVDAVARRNVLMTVEQIRLRSDVLRDLDDTGEIRIVGAMYDLHTGVVDFFDPSQSLVAEA